MKSFPVSGGGRSAFRSRNAAPNCAGGLSLFRRWRPPKFTWRASRQAPGGRPRAGAPIESAAAAASEERVFNRPASGPKSAVRREEPPPPPPPHHKAADTSGAAIKERAETLFSCNCSNIHFRQQAAGVAAPREPLKGCRSRCISGRRLDTFRAPRSWPTRARALIMPPAPRNARRIGRANQRVWPITRNRRALESAPTAYLAATSSNK